MLLWEILRTELDSCLALTHTYITLEDQDFIYYIHVLEARDAFKLNGPIKVKTELNSANENQKNLTESLCKLPY